MSLYLYLLCNSMPTKELTTISTRSGARFGHTRVATHTLFNFTQSLTRGSVDVGTYRWNHFDYIFSIAIHPLNKSYIFTIVNIHKKLYFQYENNTWERGRHQMYFNNKIYF